MFESIEINDEDFKKKPILNLFAIVIYALIKFETKRYVKSIFINFFFILCFFQIPFLSKAQDQRTIDSLVSKLEIAKEDSNKVNIYMALLKGHIYFKNNEGYKYEAPALALSKKLQLQKHHYMIKAWAGRLYWNIGKYDSALIRHNEALKLATKYGDKKDMALLLIYIGQDYLDQNMFKEGLKYFEKALKIAQSINDKRKIFNLYNIYAYVYDLQGNLPMWIHHQYKQLEIAEQLGNEIDKAIILFNIADYRESIGEDSIAETLRNIALLIIEKSNNIDAKLTMYFYYSLKYLKEKNLSGAIKNLKSILESGTTDKATLGRAHYIMAQTFEAVKNDTQALKNYFIAYENYKETSSPQVASLFLEIGSCYTRMHKYKKAKEYFDKADSLTNVLKLNLLRTDYFGRIEQLDSALGNWKSAYLNFKTYIHNQAIINSEENKNKANRIGMQYDYDKKEAAAKAEQEKKDIKQRNFRNSIIVGLVGVLIFLFVVLRQRNKISKARKRSDELLLNILPEEVAEELKEKGSAEAKYFNEVTVMFTDFKGFTQISEKLTPSELVEVIDTCFKAFDNIIGKHKIEKIKTIGDAYMCAGGLPLSNSTHAENVVSAALEIQKFMNEHLNQRQNEGKEGFEIRIGIHTGPVVAGIVGIKKFAYDIWGDTVNIASRMESSGETGKVNISGRTYDLVKDKFKCQYRGKIQAKNKGEIDMYFVEQELWR